jgi:hypothetical protein
VIDSPATNLTRRTLFGRTALGVGGLALGSMLERAGLAMQKPAIGGLPHFAPKAKRIIYLLMNGGPPHLDMFDYKPQMRSGAARRSRSRCMATSAPAQ